MSSNTMPCSVSVIPLTYQ